MPEFDCLYFLDNLYLSIIEVKRLDLADNATAAEKFHWLKIDKESFRITPFTFRSMDSAGEVEERYFEEGFLKFNNNTGTFIEKYNSAQHPLHHNGCLKVSQETTKAINEYLAHLVSA